MGQAPTARPRDERAIGRDVRRHHAPASAAAGDRPRDGLVADHGDQNVETNEGDSETKDSEDRHDARTFIRTEGGEIACAGPAVRTGP